MNRSAFDHFVGGLPWRHSFFSLSRTPLWVVCTVLSSAVCVTGLIVQDTATHFSPLGQLVILGLIWFIVLMTFAFELVGALCLWACWFHRLGNPLRAAYHAAFDAVSAFCNAGFSTFSDSLIGFRAHGPTNAIICLLIVVGGLGFTTIRDLGQKRMRRRMRVQTKVVLTLTGLLLVVGTILVFGAEQRGPLQAMSLRDSMLASAFQSVTARTAGFKSLEIGRLAPATLLVTMILMFIGGSPGSTAGGIKTTTGRRHPGHRRPRSGHRQADEEVKEHTRDPATQAPVAGLFPRSGGDVHPRCRSRSAPRTVRRGFCARAGRSGGGLGRDALRAQRIRRCQRTLDVMLENMTQAVMVYDVEKRELACNPPMQAALKASKQSFSLASIENMEANRGFVELLRRIEETDRSPQEARVQLQLPPQESAQDIELRFVPIKDKDDTVRIVVLFGALALPPADGWSIRRQHVPAPGALCDDTPSC